MRAGFSCPIARPHGATRIERRPLLDAAFDASACLAAARPVAAGSVRAHSKPPARALDRDIGKRPEKAA